MRSAGGYYLLQLQARQEPAGTKIVDANTGQLIGMGRAFIRQLLFGICIIVSLSSFFDSSPRHQGWHDKAANSIVIRTK